MNEIVAATGIALSFAVGFAGLILGILNYFRDRAEVLVELEWDMDIVGDPGYDPNKKWGVIIVTNVGRRNTFISHPAIKLPRGVYEGETHLLIMGGVAGQKLAEGDPPARFIVTQDGLEKYKAHWTQIVAQVNDHTGKAWKSKRVTSKPSWAA